MTAYLTTDGDFWREKLAELIRYAALNPWEFIFTFLLCLSPLFLISAYLSWKLAKQIEKEEKMKKRAKRREEAIKAKAKKAD